MDRVISHLPEPPNRHFLLVGCDCATETAELAASNNEELYHPSPIMPCFGPHLLQVEWLLNDGTRIDTSSSENGKVIVARVTGSCRHILQGERTALNVISRCSGVATATSHAVQQAKTNGWAGYVAGTRKTTPGERTIGEAPFPLPT